MPKLKVPAAEFDNVESIKQEIRKEWRSAEKKVRLVGSFDQEKSTSRILDLIERLREMVGPEEFKRRFAKDPEIWGPLLRQFETTDPPKFDSSGGIIPGEGQGQSPYYRDPETGRVEPDIKGRPKTGLLGAPMAELDYDSSKTALRQGNLDTQEVDVYRPTPYIPEEQMVNPEVQRSQYENELRRTIKDGRTRGFATQGKNAGLPLLDRHNPFRDATADEMAQVRSMLGALDERRLDSTNPLRGMPDIGNYQGGFIGDANVLGEQADSIGGNAFYNEKLGRRGGPVTEGLSGPPPQSAVMGPQDEYIPEGDPRYDRAMSNLDELPKTDAKKLKKRIKKGAGLTSGIAFMIGSMIASAGEKSDSETMKAIAEQINEGMDWYDEKVIQRGYEAMGTSREGLLGEDAGFVKGMLGDTAAEAYGLLANVTD